MLSFEYAEPIYSIIILEIFCSVCGVWKMVCCGFVPGHLVLKMKLLLEKII
jgi:hypothetical protein